MKFFTAQETASHVKHMGVGGIYKIENLVNGKFYIGRSESLGRRYVEHKLCLSKGKLQHKTSLLRRAWQKYGSDNFKFIVLETVSSNDKNALCDLEQEYLDRLCPWNSRIGYNIDHNATGFVSSTGSAAVQKQVNAGRRFDGEFNHNARLSETQVQQIRERYVNLRESSSTLASEFGVSKKTICEIVQGEYWANTPGPLRTFDMPRRSHMTLNESQRQEIANLYAHGGMTYNDLADMFQCTRNMVNRAIRFYKNRV